MNKIICKLDEVPLNMAIHGYINKKYEMYKYKKMPHEIQFENVMKFRIKGFEHEKALASVEEACRLYGWWGFMSHFKDSFEERDKYYGGFSITHNPDLYYMIPEGASTLGEPKINLHDFFFTDLGRQVWVTLEERSLTPLFTEVCFSGGLPAAKEMLLKYSIIDGNENFDWNKSYTPEHKQTKNGYFDAYGFRFLTQSAKHGYHGKLLQTRFQRNIIRSRVAYINGACHAPRGGEYMWHCDEPVVLNLRINIPLRTTKNYAFEIKDSYMGNFEPGYAYTWNTETLHRVYSTEYDEISRVNMVIGSSPWFDYDHEQRAYVSNKFFGEMHPFDMLAQGHIIKDIEIC